MAKKTTNYDLTTQEHTGEIVTKIENRDLVEIEDRKMVTGTFHYRAKPGGSVKFGGMRKYKGEKLKTLEFRDGHVYTIPKWMADWLNGIQNNPSKTPAAIKLIHTDQWNDVDNKKPLQAPVATPIYGFSPVAKW